MFKKIKHYYRLIRRVIKILKEEYQDTRRIKRELDELWVAGYFEKHQNDVANNPTPNKVKVRVRSTKVR